MISRPARLLCSLCLLVPLTFADGMAFKYGIDFSTLKPLAENEQMAIIAQRDGIQRMILAVSFEETAADDRAVWIVPIPGTPDEIKIDIADEMPRIMGRDVLQSAEGARDGILSVAAVFTIAPICLMIPSLSTTRGFAYEHVEVSKHGLRLATVTAANADELIDYFQSNNVKIEAEMLRSLGAYMNERHTFVIGWVSSRAELLRDYPDLKSAYRTVEQRPGFCVEFPSNVPFFPLVPTSYYGDLDVPLRLIVTGFQQLPADIGWSSHRTRWCRAFRRPDAETCEFLQIEPNSHFDYTVITADVAASEYTRDLRLEPATSPELRRALWTISQIPGPLAALYVIVVVALCSYLAGGMTGLIFFGRFRPLALFGLTNLLTVLGMMFLVRMVNFSEISSRWPTTHENVKRRCFVLGFVIVYLITVPLIGYPVMQLIA